MKNFLKKLLAIFGILFLMVLTYSQFYNPSNTNYTLDHSLKTQISSNTSNYIELDKLPKNLVNATIAMEDKRFYRHGGFDILAIMRAAIIDIKEGRFVQGGSTITQQLAKNLFLSRRKSLIRKFNEIIIAAKLERMFTKEDILEMYLNIIYYGAGAYGVNDASNVFFSKNVSTLTLEECAMLAGLPQAPSRYNPVKHLDKAKKRQKIVMSVMLKNGYIR
ncbi:transglycosylase domain-containing protein [Vallitalea sp.]|jgi:penicillin-binding protein 1A/penicillin-binding protein 2A|uniref:transglycosylase domain-containing protein n=1 Tax=Vallitalea sp. TaxID=1882829 RepID=UPI0025FCD254|nr:biosynthetic peptidoglycan transglycosylase [Vallitalea sp.]MCT4687759.1 transglycosylase domain-containing protein [Vallitalea sp.]